MKSDTLEQEVMLMISSSFARSQFTEINQAEQNPGESSSDSLERACWNGFIDVLLFGVFKPAECRKKLFLWSVSKKKRMLRIQLGESPTHLEKDWSLDPDFFLDSYIFN